MAMWISKEYCDKLFGEESSDKFIEIFGGKCLYIPKKPSRKHLIARTVGFAGMAKLCKEHGLSTVNIAKGNSNNKKLTIIRLSELGFIRNEIADALDVTNRYVNIVLNKYKNFGGKLNA